MKTVFIVTIEYRDGDEIMTFAYKSENSALRKIMCFADDNIDDCKAYRDFMRGIWDTGKAWIDEKQIMVYLEEVELED